MTRTRVLWLSVGGVTSVLVALDVVAGVVTNHQSVVWAWVAPLAGLAFVLGGLVGWTLRPGNNTGRLLVVTGVLFLVLSTFWAANDPLLYTFGLAFGSVYLAVFLQLLLSYPTGRLQRTVERRLVAGLWVIASLASVLPTLFDGQHGCKHCPANRFLIDDDRGLKDALNNGFTVLGVLIFLGVFVLLARRWRQASPARRRVLLPVYLAGGLAVVMIGIGFAIGSLSQTAADIVWVSALVFYIALPFFFVAGLLRTRFSRAGVRVLAQASDEADIAEAQTVLREVVGDPSLLLAEWSEDQGVYVDVEGNPFRPAPEGNGRLSTPIEYRGRPLAMIEYDSSLRHEPELLEEVITTARLALEKDRGLRALRLAESRQRALLDAMPDLMIRTARDGTYLDVKGNPAALIRPASELIGRTIWDVVPAERARSLMACVERTLETGEAQTIEYQLELDGQRRDFEARMVPSGEDEVLAVVREFTERRLLQDELRERLGELEREQEVTRRVVNVAPIVFLLVDPDGHVVRFNDTCETLSGHSEEEVRGRLFWEVFVVPEDGDAARLILAQLASGAPAAQQQLRWRAADGSDRILSTSSTTILDGRGRVRFLICGLDVTERERHVEELRASRARIVEAGDSERRRLERNLHDGAQQRLVSLSLALRLAESRLREDPDDAELLLRGAREELSLALEELRELARGIHPAILSDRGLAAALEALARRAPLPVELESLPDERLPGPVEAAAFYVVSESLTNVAKYAQATCAHVRVRDDGGLAVVEVEDDGVGGADPALGSGLRGLADRVEALNGRLDVESSPGSGTRVRATIPIAAPHVAEESAPATA